MSNMTSEHQQVTREEISEQLADYFEGKYNPDSFEQCVTDVYDFCIRGNYLGIDDIECPDFLELIF